MSKPGRISLLAALIVASLSLAACQRAPDQAPFEVLTGSQGCVIERITSEGYDEFQFQGVSHDGQWLAAGWTNSEADPVHGAYRLNLLTGERHELPAPLNNVPSFSPDGSLLVGAYYNADGMTDIYEHSLETGETMVIAPDSAWDWLASYSPDGGSILFNSYRSGNSEIYLYDRSGQTWTQLTDHESYDANAEFSPDGSKILFHRMVEQRGDGSYDFDLYSLDLASGEETRLTSTSSEESYGSWAPDGRRLVLSSDADAEPGQSNLYVRDSDGTLTQLTGGDWIDRYSYWTRDGSYIYFNSNRSGNEAIYRITMDGSDCAKAS